MTNTLQLLHVGHRIGKAFNSKNSKSKSVLYCQDCAGEFHGCYCDDLENCLNCEEVAEFQFIWYKIDGLTNKRVSFFYFYASYTLTKYSDFLQNGI